MNKLVYILGAFLLFAACSDEDELEYAGNRTISTIQLSAEDFTYGGRAASRALAGNILDFRWTAGDTVGIFPESGAQLGLPMTAGTGTADLFKFDGGAWALKSSCSYSAYSPYQGDFYMERTHIPATYAGQLQKGNGSAAHLRGYDYMATGSTFPQGERLALNFRHLGTLLEIRIATPEPMALQAVELCADRPVFVQNGTFNPADFDGGIKASASTSSVRIDLEEVCTVKDSLEVTVYCMAAPFNMNGKSLQIKVTDASGNVQTVAVPGEDYQAGRAYVLSAGLKAETFQGDAYRVEVPGSLPELIGDADKYRITSLKLSGSLNGTDIRFIREMAGLPFENEEEKVGVLRFLDMQDARIVAGGGCYLNEEDCITEDDVLGMYMFYESRLEKVILPKNLQKIDEMAFAMSNSLESVSMPQTVKEIGEGAFAMCVHLKDIYLPKDLETIGEEAFAYCDTLESVSFPAGLRTLDKGVFMNCRNLKSVQLPEGLQEIGYALFLNCEVLEDLVLPAALKSIGRHAFRNCNGLKELNFPAGLETIHAGAYANCCGLTALVLPSSVEELGDNAFKGCENLVTADLSASRICEVGSYAFQNCTRLKKVMLPKTAVHIWNEAFGYCTSLTDVYLPEGVEEINWEAFKECTALKRIVIPGSVTELARSFVGCTGLKEVIIRNGRLTQFNGGSLNFLEGADLEKIWLPNSLKQIDSGILNGCKSLKELYCFAEEPPFLYENNAFNPACRIYVPQGSVEKYKTAESWKARAACITAIPEGVSND